VADFTGTLGDVAYAVGEFVVGNEGSDFVGFSE
jgi:hypothetical protein